MPDYKDVQAVVEGAERLLAELGLDGVPRLPEHYLAVIREDPYNTEALRELALYNRQGLCSGDTIADALEYGLKKIVSEQGEVLSAKSGLLEGAEALEMTEDIIYDRKALQRLKRKRCNTMRYRGVSVPIR